MGAVSRWLELESAVDWAEAGQPESVVSDFEILEPSQCELLVQPGLSLWDLAGQNGLVLEQCPLGEADWHRACQAVCVCQGLVVFGLVLLCVAQQCMPAEGD